MYKYILTLYHDFCQYLTRKNVNIFTYFKLKSSQRFIYFYSNLNLKCIFSHINIIAGNIFNQDKNMQHKIEVCMGSSCFARGNLNNLNYIENFIKENGLDTKIDLTGAHCREKCENGPHIFIDGIEYCEVEENKLKELLENLST